MQTCKKPNRSSFLSMQHDNDDMTDPQTRPTLLIHLVKNWNVTQIFFSFGQWTKATKDPDVSFHVLVQNSHKRSEYPMQHRNDEILK